ncbi:DUF2069 domain-containing protein [Aquisalimonas sp. 2447]|uniref:DUF2069 domain-containing protein n=1 Tax=Aquisalimonas sp. 2447 TaxID=2740807 RepID=UPI001432603D|nr:DUF2069 domain-containing protein [Aquisalimonas sp. 2447]QIT54745.1 DUF2069 domain-containing protein [Aquisalimonas sp. 2447]
MNSVRLTHRLTITAHLGLIILLLSWPTWLAPPANPGLVAPLLLLAVGPLAAGVRGILYGRPYTCAWTSLLSMGYFVHGVAYINSPDITRWLAGAEIVLSLLLFLGCVLYVRLTRDQG